MEYIGYVVLVGMFALQIVLLNKHVKEAWAIYKREQKEIEEIA